MISRVRMLVAASLVGAAALSSPARAQTFTTDSTASADSVAPSQAPTMANASVGIRNAAVAPAVQPTAGAKAPVFQARTSGRGSVALMIVGAAVIFAGTYYSISREK